MSDTYMTSTSTPKCHLTLDEHAEVEYSAYLPGYWTLPNDSKPQENLQETTNALIREYNEVTQETLTSDHFQEFLFNNIASSWQDIDPAFIFTPQTTQSQDPPTNPPEPPPTAEDNSVSPETATAAAILVNIHENRQSKIEQPTTLSNEFPQNPIPTSDLAKNRNLGQPTFDKLSVLLHTNDSLEFSEFDIPSPVAPDLTVGQYENLISAFSMISDIIDFCSTEDRTKFAYFLKKSMHRQYERIVTPIQAGKPAGKSAGRPPKPKGTPSVRKHI
jgi:hypothetical protein